jgi:hypothetical protein
MLRRFSHKEMTMTLDLPKPIAAYFTADKGDPRPFLTASPKKPS